MKSIDHPAVGRLDLHYDALPLPDGTDRHLVIYTASADSETATALALLRIMTADPALPGPE